MANKIAFLFPGQGSQYVGMGREVLAESALAAQLIDQAGEVLQLDLRKICLEGPEKELNNTQNTQPAIYTVSIILEQIIRARGIEPAMVAGHSLGEYTALTAAGVLSFADGLKLVRKRGLLMNQALPPGQGTMAAIIGLSVEAILEICREVSGICEVANYNSPQQIVISGEVAAVRSAVKLALAAKAKRAIELEVSGPFHSSLMKPAEDSLAEELAKVDFKKPEIAFLANVTAGIEDSPEQIRELLIQQLTSSVRWEETINTMVENGVEYFIEVGPGKVLKSLLRRINRSLAAEHVEDLNGLERLLEKMQVRGK